MTTPTITVAANGYTRDHVAIAMNRGLRVVPGLPPTALAVVDQIETGLGIVRFVTDNDLDDGVFMLVDSGEPAG